jgi:hypothetical protein
MARWIRSAAGGGPWGTNQAIPSRNYTMKKVLLTISVMASWIASAEAQDLAGPGTVRNDKPAPHAVAAVPTTYGSYQQESSREYLLRRARERAEARQARIEGMRWLGYSSLRPTVTATPFSAQPPTWGAFTVGAYWSYPYWFHPANFAAPNTAP